MMSRGLLLARILFLTCLLGLPTLKAEVSSPEQTVAEDAVFKSRRSIQEIRAGLMGEGGRVNRDQAVKPDSVYRGKGELEQQIISADDFLTSNATPLEEDSAEGSI